MNILLIYRLSLSMFVMIKNLEVCWEILNTMSEEWPITLHCWLQIGLTFLVCPLRFDKFED